VELALAPHQAFHDAHEVAAHGAADAAIVHLEHFLIGADDEVVVDSDLAEFVDNDGVFLAVILRQDAVQQRGLAGPEIAGQHGHGNFGSLRHFSSEWGPLARLRPARWPPLYPPSALVRAFILCLTRSM